MSNQEKVIKENRIIKAAQNNLMGIAGKLGQITKILGTPILRQGGGLFESRYLDEPYEEENQEIPEAEDDVISLEGWLFDGLSRGMHLEIKFTIFDKKLEVSYKGYCVYLEVNESLESYAPFPDWEDLVTKLYQIVKEKQKNMEKPLKEQKKAKAAAEAKSFLQKLRIKWGI